MGPSQNCSCPCRELRVPDTALVYNNHNARWNISKMYGHSVCKTKSMKELYNTSTFIQMCHILTFPYPYSRWIGNPPVFCYFVWMTEDEAS